MFFLTIDQDLFRTPFMNISFSIQSSILSITVQHRRLSLRQEKLLQAMMARNLFPPHHNLPLSLPYFGLPFLPCHFLNRFSHPPPPPSSQLEHQISPRSHFPIPPQRCLINSHGDSQPQAEGETNNFKYNINLASKLHGVNAAIIIFVLVLYCVVNVYQLVRLITYNLK